MAFEFKAHHPIMREGALVGYRETPYISVAIGGDTAAVVVNIQAGKFWGSGGTEIPLEDVPIAVLEAVEKFSDATRESVGLVPGKRYAPNTGKKVAA